VSIAEVVESELRNPGGLRPTGEPRRDPGRLQRPAVLPGEDPSAILVLVAPSDPLFNFERRPGDESIDGPIVEVDGASPPVGLRRSLRHSAPDAHTRNRLNNKCQQLLIDTGHLDPSGRSLKTGDQILYEGDEVVTRRNDRTLRTSKGLMVRNRDHWTIHRIHSDGTVTITGPTGPVTLPAEYVTGHVELGYAQTSHASQGRIVDLALLLVDGPIDSRGVYTPMTRGREVNHAYVATEGNETGADLLTQAVTRQWVDQSAVARRDRLDPHRARRPGPGHLDEQEEHERMLRRARQRVIERQEQRRLERTLGRGL